MTTLKTALFSLILFSCLFGDCHNRVVYRKQELSGRLGALILCFTLAVDALQAILGAWNASTPSRYLAGWSSTQIYPCSSNHEPWQGVVCVETPVGGNSSDFNSIVVSLSTPDGGILGTLPPEIGNLTNLVFLTLTGSQPKGSTGPGISGPMPKELGRLTNLKTLSLNYNGFNGSIPEELLNLSGLQDLDLSFNQLSGKLPNIGGMKFLRTMSVSGNQLSGPLPFNISTGVGLHNLTDLISLDLSNNNFTGSTPDITLMLSLQKLYFNTNQFNNFVKPASNLSQLSWMSLSTNSFAGPIPDLSILSQTLQGLHLGWSGYHQGDVALDWLWNFSSLNDLNLSACELLGEFPYDVVKSPSISKLTLEHNNISGDLNITRIIQLTSSRSSDYPPQISVVYNNITTVHYTPADLIRQNTDIKLSHNPYCSKVFGDGPGRFCNQTLDHGPSTHSVRRAIIISVAVSATTMAFVIFIAVLLFWRNKRDKRYLLLQVEQKFAEFEVKPTIFTYTELRIATRDFHPSAKLGQGSYGAVFKGTLSNGMEVAVKQLFVKTEQGIDDFLNEVVLITGVKNRNLVKLKGCCLSESRRLLVYEYVENNDLAETLFEGKGGHILTWPIRLNICLGVARGLQYLHEIAQPRIIHRDIKASNILLDKNLQAKIADFGLAMLFPDNETHIFTEHVAGTKGYLAPEYATRGQLTEKADVFSFGVLVLEVVSGRKNIDLSLPPDDMYLIEQAWRLHNQGNVMELVDANLHLYGEEVVAMKQAINVALLCVLSDGEKRPSMARVVAFLQGEADAEVVIRNIGAGKFENSYENLWDVARSGLGLAMVPESLPTLFSSSARRFDSIPMMPILSSSTISGRY